MIKSELILRIAEQNPYLYEKDAEAVVNAIRDRISDALVAGDRVELRGFGAFTMKVRSARTSRNPRTGADVIVTDKLVPVFKTGKTMQIRLNVSQVRSATEQGA